ncbi:glycosyltransferase family 4 protein [Draconibacterium sp. IB214405]|uniref:glycosyltransferase family 4 protein n=1 Tax=Draconibacterium sp. IB214405 TaxID=3097352 RepID=UPI002A1420D1|nr:glycosyltransferase family 4 protein [Draconibacterium sp. IB214405]MDX8339292.1 glycosyltransferase family 4 protein [Draconibacterium sp. IB214405]
MILITGPLPEPINGCSYANEVLCQNLVKKGTAYQTINTSTPVVSSKQGTNFSLKKALGFLKTYSYAFKVFGAKAVYLTPGQTFFGVAKYAPFILLCILFHKPYVIHVHGNYLGTEYQQLKGAKSKFFRLLVSHASAGIVLSESLRKNFAGLLPDKKIFVVENFVDEELLTSYEEQKKPKDQLRILYLSNLMEEKGILDLLDALLLLQKKGVAFCVQLAGKIESNIYTEVQMKLTALGEKVEYLGLVKNESKLQAFQRANVFVLPTWYQMEGQPISILEAMGSGNIIVTTAHAGIPDIVSIENGYFVEAKNPKSIARALQTISEDIAGEVKQFSVKNATYVKSRFTEQRFSSKIMDIMENVSQMNK